jgi:hypothetical protein
VSGRRMLTARVSEVGVREVDKVADREGLASIRGDSAAAGVRGPEDAEGLAWRTGNRATVEALAAEVRR